MERLVKYLNDEGFFTSPASTRFHGCYAGGLAQHSWDVYERVLEYHMRLNLPPAPGQKPLPLNKDNIAVAALLHDVCKIGAYIPTPSGKNPYKWNRSQPKGHATLSIKRITKIIELEPIEEMMIKFHMGVYGLNEFYAEDDWRTGDYPIGEIEQVLKDCFPGPEFPIRGDHSKDDSMTKEESKLARYGKSLANVWYHNPICKIMYFCDELATLQEKSLPQ